MITFDELNSQNHQITELSNVLLYLLKDRSMCDTDTACSLFFSYMDKVRDHLAVVDQLYTTLLQDQRQEVHKVANNFMSGEQEIKKIMARYSKDWCDKKKRAVVIADHQRFLKDTREVFDMILSRIQDETEKLYPLVRELRGDSKFAA